MCGLSCIVDQNTKPVSKKEIQAMSSLVRHRGGDDNGIFMDKHIGLAHQRLAIIDLDKAAGQPMTFGQYSIIHNGEIYNYVELREALILKGYSFTTSSDTEVIIWAYAHWGKACVEQFRGMWSFIIYDKHEQILFCSRDRFGIKPLYYANVGDRFCLFSEIKQLKAFEDWKAVLNKKVAIEFLAFAYHDHSDETFFEGVLQVPKGNNLIYDLKTNAFTLQQYYHLNEFGDYSKKDFNVSKIEFERLMKASVELHLRADVPQGFTLSGGMDSSSIVGVARDLDREKELHSVSAVFSYKDIDESKYINKVAKLNSVDTRFVYSNFKEMLRLIDEVTYHQDEPVASASVIAQYLVFRMAKYNDLKVMLSGQGADEILSGYERFYGVYFKSLFRKSPLKAMVNMSRFLWHHNMGVKQIRARLHSRKQKNHSVYPNWLNVTDLSVNQLSSSKALDSQRAISLDMIYGNGLSALLHYEDRNSMAFSVESRVPFLDHHLVEFCMQLPEKYKIHHTKRKYILRESMKPYLPESVYKRYDKLGFATPQESWLKENDDMVSKMIKQTVEENPTIFNEQALHITDTQAIWRVLAFGRWVRVFEVEA